MSGFSISSSESCPFDDGSGRVKNILKPDGASKLNTEARSKPWCKAAETSLGKLIAEPSEAAKTANSSDERRTNIYETIGPRKSRKVPDAPEKQAPNAAPTVEKLPVSVEKLPVSTVPEIPVIKATPKRRTRCDRLLKRRQKRAPDTYDQVETFVSARSSVKKDETKPYPTIVGAQEPTGYWWRHANAIKTMFSEAVGIIWQPKKKSDTQADSDVKTASKEEIRLHNTKSDAFQLLKSQLRKEERGLARCVSAPVQLTDMSDYSERDGGKEKKGSGKNKGTKAKK